MNLSNILQSHYVKINLLPSQTLSRKAGFKIYLKVRETDHISTMLIAGKNLPEKIIHEIILELDIQIAINLHQHESQCTML